MSEDKFENIINNLNKKDLFVKLESNQTIQTADSLNITTHHTSIPIDRTVYIIQAKIDGKWQDVIFSKGCTPDKKARHYRNKHKVETRVIRIIEHCFYSYDYEVTDNYIPNDDFI